MKNLFTSVLAGFFFTVVFARAGNIPTGDIKTAARLIAALKAGDKAAVSKLMRYPISRHQPLSSISTPEKLVEHYGEFFDAKTIPAIEAGMKSIWVNWQGTAIGDGLVWISGGRIIALNVETDVQKAAAEIEKKAVEAGIHISARTYDKALFDCSTKKHRIRIHADGEKIRYFSWKKGQPLSEKPELALEGTMDVQGSGGNTVYTFENKGYRYEVDQTVLCGEDCSSRLIVAQGPKRLSNEVCVITPQ